MMFSIIVEFEVRCCSVGGVKVVFGVGVAVDVVV